MAIGFVGQLGGAGGSAGAASAIDYGNPVQDLTALRAVPPALRGDKQQRLVEDENAEYRFDDTGVGADDGDLIIAPDTGTGRWFKITPSGGIPSAHAASHENSGSDEISVAGLSGLLADDQNPTAHASDHENGGGDEISVAGLSGELADPQPPKTHASDHADGGSDEVPVAGLAEAAAPSNDVSQALRPDGVGGVAFSDVAHSDLTGVGADDHHAQDHAARHAAATGADALSTAAAGAIAIGDAAAVGVAETFARSDHKHSLAVPAAPEDVTKAAAVAGTDVEPARADHKHDISTAAPTGIGTANAEGSASSVARSDHVHDHGAQTAGTHHAAATGSVNGFMASADKTKLDNIPLKNMQLFADQLDNPVNVDWAVNALAPAVVDSNDNNKTIRAFDDTVEQGVGWVARPPLGSTSIVLKFVARAEAGPPAARTVGLKLYQQGNPDNAALEAWSAGLVLTDIDVPTTTEFFQYDSQTITLASLGITAGEVTHFQLTRIAPTGGTNLVGDWDLLELEVDFI